MSLIFTLIPTQRSPWEKGRKGTMLSIDLQGVYRIRQKCAFYFSIPQIPVFGYRTRLKGSLPSQNESYRSISIRFTLVPSCQCGFFPNLHVAIRTDPTQLNMKFNISVLAAVCMAFSATGQITTPPNGGNQHARSTQWMGPIEIEVDYYSPDVHAPDGSDRTGHIWGELVPYGMNNLGFGLSSDEHPSPWRAGANENTTVTFSHDVMVEGSPLAAGKYGLHMIVKEEGPWTVIFSRNNDEWGSFFYDPAFDALRVECTPYEHPFTEWLNYTFTDRQLTECTLEMQWENVALPIHISSTEVLNLYADIIEGELKNDIGFDARNWANGAMFLVSNNMDLEKADRWADYSLNGPFIGERNTITLNAKASVLMAQGKTDEAKPLIMEIVRDPGGSVFQNHAIGRGMIAVDPEFALEVFKTNAEMYPDTWPVNVGLMRGYSAVGDYDKAVEYGEKALENVPEGDNLNGPAIQANLERLRNGENIN